LSDFIKLSIVDLYATPFEEFKKELCERYKGRTVSMLSLYHEDSPNTRFVLKQYKKAMIVLYKFLVTLLGFFQKGFVSLSYFRVI
jgi:hypothetical protein